MIRPEDIEIRSATFKILYNGATGVEVVWTEPSIIPETRLCIYSLDKRTYQTYLYNGTLFDWCKRVVSENEFKSKNEYESRRTKMSKELEALNYLVGLAVVGNKEKHRGKIFDSEEVVLKAFKRNEPMKPFIYNLGAGDEFHVCPNCAVNVIRLDNKYCSECGQKLDWSDKK